MQWFDINHVTGLITTRLNIDRETQSDLKLLVSARDGGTSPKFATATVAVTIEDENDESPRFLLGRAGRLQLEISENTRVGSKIATLQAVDNDRGRNGSVRYQLGRGAESRYPGVFSLDPGTGDITVNSVLDRETSSSYQLTVFASDGGEPSRTSSMEVNIKVIILIFFLFH